MNCVWVYRDNWGGIESPLFSSVDVANEWLARQDSYTKECVFNDVYHLAELEVL